jgi:hypothetical protein
MLVQTSKRSHESNSIVNYFSVVSSSDLCSKKEGHANDSTIKKKKKEKENRKIRTNISLRY